MTAVRNWNAAARLATGDILIVASDDLWPDSGWDVKLEELIGRLEPVRDAFAIKVFDAVVDVDQDPCDSGLQQSDTLIRHPIISRGFYARNGLFSSEFTGIGCDVDFARRALWDAAIIDGRRIRFDHRHHSANRPTEESASHSKINDPGERLRASAALNRLWTPRQLAARVRLLKIRTGRIPLSREVLVAFRVRNAILATIAWVSFPARSWLVRRLPRPGHTPS